MPRAVQRAGVILALVLAWLVVDALLRVLLGAVVGGGAGLLVGAYFVYVAWAAWRR